MMAKTRAQAIVAPRADDQDHYGSIGHVPDELGQLTQMRNRF